MRDPTPFWQLTLALYTTFFHYDPQLLHFSFCLLWNLIHKLYFCSPMLFQRRGSSMFIAITYEILLVEMVHLGLVGTSPSSWFFILNDTDWICYNGSGPDDWNTKDSSQLILSFCRLIFFWGSLLVNKPLSLLLNNKMQPWAI